MGSYLVFFPLLKNRDKIYNLNHFQVWSSTVTYIHILYNQSVEFFSPCKTEIIDIKQLPIPLISALGYHHSIFCLCEFDYSRYLIEVESYHTLVVFHLAYCLQGSSMS